MKTKQTRNSRIAKGGVVLVIDRPEPKVAANVRMHTYDDRYIKSYQTYAGAVEAADLAVAGLGSPVGVMLIVAASPSVRTGAVRYFPTFHLSGQGMQYLNALMHKGYKVVG